MKLIYCDETLRKVEQIPFIANENKAFHEGCRYMQKKVLKILHESKSVDAELVRHGHWILEREPNGNPYCFHCSVCDDDFHHINIMSATDYCPNCGAKMDEEEDK